MKTTRSYRRVSLYLLQEFLLSFLVAFLFFFFIFFVNQMLLLARDILTRDVAPFDVVRLIWYSLPSIVALSFPFGSLVGALMAVGRLSSDNEILALQAAGMPLLRLALPFLTAGVLLSVGSFVMNDYFLPVGTINFGSLYRELLYANPGLELEPFSINRYQESIMITGAVDGGRIEDLVIIEQDDRGARRVILSRNARFGEEGNDAVISLELSDVFSQRVDARNREQYDWLSAEQMQYNILLRDIAVALRSPGPREMSSVDVYREIEAKRRSLSQRLSEHQKAIDSRLRDLHLEYAAITQQYADSDADPAQWHPALHRRLESIQRDAARPIVDRSLQIYEIEYHKKFSIPFACLVFALFAFPVGLTSRRSGRSVGFGLGLLVSVIYWAMLIGGQTLGVQRTDISPLLAMWVPNIVIAAGGAVFLLIRLRR
ncbi:MAG: YjgP/YjgQ family permease [Spirochaetaceae bacterium]|nr:MAG: YjgP/YjgQ family permease [Spirochaetaceae bacterium]